MIKKINKSYKRGEKNFWMKVANKTQREERITSIELFNNKISSKFEKFTQFWKRLYSEQKEKPNNIGKMVQQRRP